MEDHMGLDDEQEGKSRRNASYEYGRIVSVPSSALPMPLINVRMQCRYCINSKSHAAPSYQQIRSK